MKFCTRQVFREDLKFQKNEKHKIISLCKNECEWRLHAFSIMKSSTFQVKRIENIIRDNSHEGIESFKNKIKRDLQVDCNMHKLYRAKTFALELLIIDFMITVQQMCFYLNSMRKGFLEGCKPIKGLDGCFLQELYRGQMLSAIGRDMNDNMYPIAIAYVEIEKQDNWEWFLNLLLRDLGSHNEMGWTFISNKYKGLIETFNSLTPHAEHRFCLRHMCNNFKGKFKGQELNRLISLKRGNDQTIYEWVNNVPSHNWATCLFLTRSKYDVNVNNISKSFNNYILDVRELAIIDMFDKYLKVDTVFLVGGKDKFEVMHFLKIHIVFLNDKHCSCGMFQLCGYPCCHALIAIRYHRINVEDYVQGFFKKDMYLRVYSHMVNPVPRLHDFEEFGLGPVNPPNIKLNRGRPKKVRRKDVNNRMDQDVISRIGLTHTCVICLMQGHNKRSCISNVKETTISQAKKSSPSSSSRASKEKTSTSCNFNFWF
ncbi:hypothetical protein Pfo_019087 [Paulownia fortunei]|nr:hypothetical protein Pfo_019087 [Paulownia fortunei]